MKYYGQNFEDKLVHEYFGNYKGTLLDIGANAGDYLSNSLALIRLGWKACLFEPSEQVFGKLKKLHTGNRNVKCYNYGIGATDGPVQFWDSAEHVKGGKDRSLVSTTEYAETEKWRAAGVVFMEKQINLMTFDTFLAGSPYKTFDFISLDTEGKDWEILQQIDLKAVGCKGLCVEFNGDEELKDKFSSYCSDMRLVHQNAENLLFFI